jgi:hypothetical protein
MKLISTILVGASLSGAVGGLLWATPSHAAKAIFACAEHEGRLATVVKTKKGDVPLIYWDTNMGVGYTPNVRCDKVSSRFTKLYNNGKLKYLATGRVNSQPVICATTSKSARCNSSNLLFTVKPGSDPRNVLQQLNAVRNRAAGSSAVEESASSVPANPSTDNLVDMEDWLRSVEN